MGERAQHYIPRSVTSLAGALAEVAPAGAPSTDHDDFLLLSRLVSIQRHVVFHDRARQLTDAWEDAPDDPDAAAVVEHDLEALLADAKYIEMSPTQLDEAMRKESSLPLRLEVDLEPYGAVLVHRRGSRRAVVDRTHWGGLRTTQHEVMVDKRVVVHTRVRQAGWFAERGIDPAARGLVPGHVALKQFRDVPRADIEMLLPSARVRMRRIDSLIVGVPAVASGVAVLSTKLLPTLGMMFVLVAAWLGLRDDQPRLDQGALVVLFGGVVTLGGFLLRQWTKLKNRRLTYLKTLSESLYFRTIADGPGVLHSLLDAAEQQGTIEVLLAYRHLLAAPEPLTPARLDAVVERWLAETCELTIDFQVDHAVAKLRDLDLVVDDGPSRDDETRLVARPLPEAIERLDARWDELFRPTAVRA